MCYHSIDVGRFHKINLLKIITHSLYQCVVANYQKIYNIVMFIAWGTTLLIYFIVIISVPSEISFKEIQSQFNSLFFHSNTTLGSRFLCCIDSFDVDDSRTRNLHIFLNVFQLDVFAVFGLWLSCVNIMATPFRITGIMTTIWISANISVP